jgi:hypothetical protein
VHQNPQLKKKKKKKKKTRPPRGRMIRVKNVQGRHVSARANGLSDAYCTVSFLSFADRTRTAEPRSDPVFANAAFQFACPQGTPPDALLTVAVWDECSSTAASAAAPKGSAESTAVAGYVPIDRSKE